MATIRDVARELTMYHPGNGSMEQDARFAAIRKAGEDFIAALLENGTPGSDLTHAVRQARDAQQWAIASIVVPAVMLPRGPV